LKIFTQIIVMRKLLIVLFSCSLLFATAQKKKEVASIIPTASPDSIFKNLKWRNVGPFRGGRANAISGVINNDQKFYAGYTGGGVWTTEDGGVVKLMDDSAFAGSTATANRLIKTMTKTAGVSLVDAVKMMTATPARILHLGRQIGSLKKRMDADIVIFNQDIEINRTISKG
jgi:hypothetical protein